MASEPCPLAPIAAFPIQARGAARVELLLDIAAELLDEIGYERMTTQIVADRAGMSIGSVYTYFANRRLLVRALAARNLDRFVDRTATMMAAGAFEHYVEPVDDIIEAFADMCRSEPGFRLIRFGDVIDELLIAGTASSNQLLADAFVALLVDVYGVAPSPNLGLYLQAAIEIADALLARAFLHDPEGDPWFIAECKYVVRNYLVSHLGNGRPNPGPTLPDVDFGSQ